MPTGLLIILAFFIGCVVGAITLAILTRKQNRKPATPLQRALSACVAEEIRVARMHGTFDGWSLAHRTDSEG